MVITSIALLGSTCLILTILSAIIKDRHSLLGIMLSALTGVFLLVFAMIASNLSNSLNALSLFIMIGLALYMGSRLIESSKVENTNMQNIVSGLFKILALVAFAFAIFSLNVVNIFATIGGVLISAGIGLVLLATNRNQAKSSDFITFIIFAAIGLMIGFAVGNILDSQNIISAILLLLSSLLFLAGQISQYLIINETSRHVATTIIMNAAMIMLVVAIFLY